MQTSSQASGLSDIKPITLSGVVTLVFAAVHPRLSSEAEIEGAAQ